jgi:hypothetical protein
LVRGRRIDSEIPSGGFVGASLVPAPQNQSLSQEFLECKVSDFAPKSETSDSVRL